MAVAVLSSVPATLGSRTGQRMAHVESLPACQLQLADRGVVRCSLATQVAVVDDVPVRGSGVKGVLAWREEQQRRHLLAGAFGGGTRCACRPPCMGM